MWDIGIDLECWKLKEKSFTSNKSEWYISVLNQTLIHSDWFCIIRVSIFTLVNLIYFQYGIKHKARW